MSNGDWTREQTIIAFNVYCKIQFKKSSKTNPTIIKYANIIGRSPSALNMKIGNFGRLDPELRKQGITGLRHGAKLEEDVWDEFNNNWDALVYESELLIAKFQNKRIEEILDNNDFEFPIGREKERTIKQRVNQSFFRSTILSAYNLKCCITGLSIPDLLVSSHILPWAKDESNRLNPRNGLCLNTLHDKAFDKGYITIRPDYTVKISSLCKEILGGEAVEELFTKYDNRSISLPDKFLPGREFLDYHYSEIFKK
ncbi:restriction endonuclease [Pedobacter yonginense]|uniref:Restriction endonuclease n=1 Tax=Pedobacter yonginense TaxID=651869 RepID=A0A317EM72_9SPHI|nr:HNH endonuclease [Pedobacter yonginense]PWS27704.1 restriction endonuclease [Pedobacter yonginense]